LRDYKKDAFPPVFPTCSRVPGLQDNTAYQDIKNQEAVRSYMARSQESRTYSLWTGVAVKTSDHPPARRTCSGSQSTRKVSICVTLKPLGGRVQKKSNTCGVTPVERRGPRKRPIRHRADLKLGWGPTSGTVHGSGRWLRGRVALYLILIKCLLNLLNHFITLLIAK
jgi:hypothetical protein